MNKDKPEVAAWGSFHKGVMQDFGYNKSATEAAAKLDFHGRALSIEPLIRQSDHIEHVLTMVEALKEARDVLVAAIKASAPDYFRTDEDAAKHLTILKIDRALGGVDENPAA